MPTLRDSLVSTSARVLSLRMRPDLEVQQQRYQGEIYWVVKDPIALQYYRFQEEEFAILQMLDGHSSLDDVKERFENQFPPQKITVEELGQFVGMLHRSALVIADVPGQGVQLKRRRDERKRRELLGAFANILAIRFKGIDPDRLLNFLYPYVRWVYSPLAMAFWVLLGLSALMLVLVQFDVFQAKLPTFHQFFTPSNWIYLGTTLALTKVLHEFGHGMTCKHFGGECHEMGVMLLVLTPCLYCNVSDSWMLPNKWHRAWIGAAGMCVEMVIASVCTFLWWFSEPGMLNQLCLSTMFVCSVSTVMFNANPLLRYDGYYILADITEIPNLRQKATTILNRKLSAWCLGLEEPEDPFLPQKNQVFFALYSVAAAIYRWLVLFSILWFLYKLLEPYGLKVLSQMIATASVVSLIGQPLWKLGKFFYIPGRLEQVKPARVQATLGVLTVLALFIFAVPLPHRIICTLEVKPADAELIYVEVPGRLEEIFVKSGQEVHKGEALARLSSLDVERELADLEGKYGQYKMRLESRIHTGSDDPETADEIPQLKELVAMMKEELEQKQDDLKRLQLVSPIDGTVLPGPHTPSRQNDPRQLKNWTGTPLSDRNLGATLTDSTLFCQIGKHQWEADLVVEQDDIEFIAIDQPVLIKLDAFPHRTFHSKITDLAKTELAIAPRALTSKAGGEMATKTDESGAERPMNTSYQANAPIEDPDNLFTVGLKGQAKVSTRWQTIGARVWRYITHTFNFKL